MIFATVGSHPSFRFDRLLSALAALPGDELVVQHGPGDPPPQAREAIAFMSFEQILERMQEASVVVSHAGVGSILCALQAGRVPVVMPREARFDETVDDHQVELAEALAPTGRIVLVETEGDLPAAVAEARSRDSAPLRDATELLGAVRSELYRT
ncbi:MAG TPA: glycosyltransferase [Solirubrobacterales bacterium]|nr:glycosyltransferase [Solirubrobacterales bacterium]